MTQGGSLTLRKPRTDDRPLWDAIFGIVTCPALLVAHDLKLFPLLAGTPRSLGEICDALKLARRPAEALLSICVALGVATVRDDRYVLTALGEDYLLESSPTSFTGILDLTIEHFSLYSFESVKRGVLTDIPQAYGGNDWVDTHRQDEVARFFTRAMHSSSMGPALAWPDAVDLSAHQVMLDVGGGSGAHSIGAALAWPDLAAIVFDIPPVCKAAAEFIAGYGLQHRITTHVGDMWTDPFPPADVHFYSMVYHDWPPEKCRVLTRKSFESLAPGGRIIVHEMLLNDEKTGPLTVASHSLDMLLWTEGRQYSGRELSQMLAEVGFTDVEMKRTFGYWNIVMGCRPDRR